MDKKKYITLIITIIIFITIIAVILINSNNKTNWIEKVKASDTYQINISNCNSKEITVPNETIDEITKKLNNVSDNGPWTGDNNKCYTTLTISYNNDDKIEYITIKIIDNNSFTLSTNGSDRYYTNSKELNTYINNLLNEY